VYPRGELGDAQAVSVLVPFLKDPHRLQRCMGAGAVGDGPARQTLLDALDDKSPNMCVARSGLERFARGSVASSIPLLNDARKSVCERKGAMKTYQ
jgi:hypothetical protein